MIWLIVGMAGFFLAGIAFAMWLWDIQPEWAIRAQHGVKFPDA